MKTLSGVTSSVKLAAVLSVVTILLPLLGGCGAGTLLPASSSEAMAGPSISGNVHGGQQGVKGAHVYLYGVNGNNASHSMLGTVNGTPSGAPVTYSNAAGYGSDSLGTYVLTDSHGNFTFNGSGVNTLNATYLCGANQLLYVLAVGGDPGVGATNPALYEMADLGPCFGTSLSSTLNVSVTEVSTVAAVYALSGYMTGPTAIGFDNTALGTTGITNASANVNQLVNLGTGTALAKTPNGNGTVPTATINTLADIMASCVNTSGPSTGPGGGVNASPNCGTLFAYATSDGTTSGTKPTDTITAMLNIAHHPAANVAGLFPLQGTVPPYPGLATAPNDFTLSIAYNNTGGLSSPGIPAVDAAGNVFFPNSLVTGGFVAGATELSPLGVPASGSPFGVAFSDTAASMAAIDPSGNAWFAFPDGAEVVKYVPGSGPTPYSYGTGNDDGHQIAIDASGNVYIDDNTVGQLYGLNNSGTANGSIPYYNGNLTRGFHSLALLNTTTVMAVESGVSIDPFDAPLTGVSHYYCGINAVCENGGLTAATALAVDSGARIWALNTNSTLSGYDSRYNATVNTNYGSGGYLTGSPFSGGGLNTTTLGTRQPYPWLAIDGGSHIWVANYTGTLSEFSSVNGAVLSPTTGLYGMTASCKAQGLAIDGAGDIWVSCDSTTAPVLEYIGAATPVYTPLTPGHFGVMP